MNRFIDLFCGIGGFRLALEKFGMECVFSSDIDKNAQDQYYKNFGEHPVGDIIEIPEKKIPKHDILCAGFPCQSFSITGKRRGFDDKCGQLFFEILRIAKHHQPPILLLENVKNIISIDDCRVLEKIIAELNCIGYDVHYDILNASHFGVPQTRKRVYFVCLRKDTKNISVQFPMPLMKEVYLEDFLSDEVPSKLFIDRKCKINEDKLTLYGLRPIRIGILNKGGQAERIYSPKGHAITISANGGGWGAKTGLYFVNGRIRKLSIDECKAVMGFPKNHKVSEGEQGYKQLGNAVIPKMIEVIFENIKKLDFIHKTG